MLTVAETTTNEVVGTVTFEVRMWVRTSVIAFTAAQSSSSSSVRPSLWISMVVAQCWSFFKGGRRATAVGLLRTACANGLDHAMRSLPQSGPIILEILRKASLMLLSERLPLMAMVL